MIQSPAGKISRLAEPHIAQSRSVITNGELWPHQMDPGFNKSWKSWWEGILEMYILCISKFLEFCKHIKSLGPLGWWWSLYIYIYYHKMCKDSNLESSVAAGRLVVLCGLCSPAIQDLTCFLLFFGLSSTNVAECKQVVGWRPCLFCSTNPWRLAFLLDLLVVHLQSSGGSWAEVQVSAASWPLETEISVQVGGNSLYVTLSL